jgi:hypothetical protein
MRAVGRVNLRKMTTWPDGISSINLVVAQAMV